MQTLKSNSLNITTQKNNKMDELTIYDVATFTQTYREKAQSRAAAYVDMYFSAGFDRDLVTAACFEYSPDNYSL